MAKVAKPFQHVQEGAWPFLFFAASADVAAADVAAADAASDAAVDGVGAADAAIVTAAADDAAGAAEAATAAAAATLNVVAAAAEAALQYLQGAGNLETGASSAFQLGHSFCDFSIIVHRPICGVSCFSNCLFICFFETFVSHLL